MLLPAARLRPLGSRAPSIAADTDQFVPEKKKKNATASVSCPIAAVATDLFSTVVNLRKVLRTEIAAVDEESVVKSRSDAENFLPASPLSLFSAEQDSELRKCTSFLPTMPLLLNASELCVCR